MLTTVQDHVILGGTMGKEGRLMNAACDLYTEESVSKHLAVSTSGIRFHSPVASPFDDFRMVISLVHVSNPAFREV